jgi:hypothetical protein
LASQHKENFPARFSTGGFSTRKAMNSYTHIVLAQQAAPLLQPQDPDAYYWGAIAPDARYLANIRRSQTHISQEELQLFMKQYPEQRSFLLGYMVHCLLDEIDLSRVVGARFPLNLARGKFSSQQMGVLVEFYFLRSKAAARSIHAAHNPILEAVGIEAQYSAAFGQAISEYLADPCVSSAVSAFQNMGLLKDRRIEKYLGAADTLNRSWLLKQILLTSVRRAGLERIAGEKIALRLAAAAGPGL